MARERGGRWNEEGGRRGSKEGMVCHEGEEVRTGEETEGTQGNTRTRRRIEERKDKQNKELIKDGREEG